MKANDLLRIARKGLKGRWAALPAAGFALAAFCLCYAGSVLWTVQQEKSQPCELTVSARASAAIADKDIAEIRNIPGVKAVTALLPVEAAVKTGKFAAQLTLTGIDGAYLTASYRLGGNFPAGGAMPRIVLNEAACRLFSDGRDDTETFGANEDGTSAPLPEIGWLTAGFTAQVSEDARPIASAVCGVMASGEGEAPAAYLSLDAARELMGNSGVKNVKPNTARVRAENIGWAESVSKALAALGLTAENGGGELQDKWDAEMNETGYLVATGAFGLLCSLTLLAARRRMSLLEQRSAWEMLEWMGMRERQISAVFVLQAVLLALAGVTAGIAAAVLLPSFLPQELKGTSIFMLQAPAEVAAACAGICVATGLAVSLPLLLLPLFQQRRRR